jgi:hypothetical protein
MFQADQSGAQDPKAEVYWTYDDIGAFFFVLVFLNALIRLSIKLHLLRSPELVVPHLAVQSFMLVFLGTSLYTILKLRYHQPVMTPLGMASPEQVLHHGFHPRRRRRGSCHCVLQPPARARDTNHSGKGLFCSGLLPGTHSRGVCIPRMLAARVGPISGECHIGGGHGSLVLGVSRSARPDPLGLVRGHGSRLRMVAPGLSHNYRSRPHACHMQPDSLSSREALIMRYLALLQRSNESCQRSLGVLASSVDLATL